MINFFKKVSVASILTSIAIGILGLIILFNPNETIALLSLILGIIIMIIGIGKIISYIILRKESNFSNYDLIYGIIAIVISIIMLANANAFATIVRVIIGIWIAYTGIMKLIYALNLKKFKFFFLDCSNDYGYNNNNCRCLYCNRFKHFNNGIWSNFDCLCSY